MVARKSPLFEPGRLLSTPGALQALERAGKGVGAFLSRHVAGDWGDLDDEDRALNDEAVEDGSRILSAYQLGNGERIWIITEAADEDGRRVATTILLPDEY